MKKLLLSLLVLVSLVSYGQVIEKETTYVLKMSEKEYQEFLNSKKENSYSKPRYVRKNFKDEKSFGVAGGYSTFLGNTSISNFSWGSWIDFGTIGLEYNMSVGVSDNILQTTYKIGDEYYGGFSRNVGVFTKTRNHIYYGGGIQFYELTGIKTELKTIKLSPTNTIVLPDYKDIDEKKVLPYVTIGYIQRLNDMFTFKGGVILSKFTMVNVGVGYSF